MRSRGRIVKSDFEERFGDLEHADRHSSWIWARFGRKRVEIRNDVGFINRVLVIIFHLAGGGINDERAMGLGMLD